MNRWENPWRETPMDQDEREEKNTYYRVAQERRITLVQFQWINSMCSVKGRKRKVHMVRRKEREEESAYRIIERVSSSLMTASESDAVHNNKHLMIKIRFSKNIIFLSLNSVI